MKRTTIWLTDLQVAALTILSKKSRLKQSELIRRFIDAGLKSRAYPARGNRNDEHTMFYTRSLDHTINVLN